MEYCIVAVDHIPADIDKAHEICKNFNIQLESLLPGKELNCNLGRFEDGKLIQVFKGTTDELNNVLYWTFKNHNQFFKNPIEQTVERDIDEKILRVSRFIITFYSKTHLRTQIKSALRGNIQEKLEVLKLIDFKTMTEFPQKKERKCDIYKVLAFQFGQVFSLIDGFEKDSYTKRNIAKNYPDLNNLLIRGHVTDSDLETLNHYLKRFIDLIEVKIQEGIKLNEKVKI